jgi:mannose-6-phosphate isomerase
VDQAGLSTPSLDNAFDHFAFEVAMMTLELVSERVVRQPWGKSDLRPWSDLGRDGTPIGELGFQRVDPAAPEPQLLLKLLFTDQALSIQVHPDDAFARTIRLPHGETEAWYVLAAAPGAEVSLGLTQSLTLPQLRTAIGDGTIVDLVHRQVVHSGESIVVAAGTIPAIDAGFVIAEIQQRIEATFRLFDLGRDRVLHPDGAVAAAVAGPAPEQATPKRLSATRLIVATSPYFVLEQIDLVPRSHWEVVADREVWILLVEGEARFDQLHVACGEAVFVDAQRVGVHVGVGAVRSLMAYVRSEPASDLLQSPSGEIRESAVNPIPNTATTRERAPALAVHQGVLA